MYILYTHYAVMERNGTKLHLRAAPHPVNETPLPSPSHQALATRTCPVAGMFLLMICFSS